MDEKSGGGFKRRKLWVGIGVLAVILLCLAVCGSSVLFFGTARPGTGHRAFGGEHPPPVGRFAGWGLIGIGLAIKLLFGGLLLLLLFYVLRRVCWGHHPRGPHPWGRPPAGTGEGVDPRNAWGSGDWSEDARHWGPPPWRGSPPMPGSDSGAEKGVPGEPGDDTGSAATDPDVAPV